MAYNKAAKDKYYAKNKDSIKAKRKVYYQSIKEKVAKVQRTPESRFRFTKNKAKREGREFDVDFNHYAELLSQTCQYCNGPLNETGCGLDRKDSAQGYTVGNVVPCCLSCNRIKNEHLTHDEMRIAMDAVIRYRKTGIIR